MTFFVPPPPPIPDLHPFPPVLTTTGTIRTFDSGTTFTVVLPAPNINHLIALPGFPQPEIEATISYELIRAISRRQNLDEAQEANGAVGRGGRLMVKVFAVPLVSGEDSRAAAESDVVGRYEVWVPGRYFDMPLTVTWGDDDEAVFVFSE